MAPTRREKGPSHMTRNRTCVATREGGLGDYRSASAMRGRGMQSPAGRGLGPRSGAACALLSLGLALLALPMVVFVEEALCSKTPQGRGGAQDVPSH